MPSDPTCWNTKKELSFLKELASRDLLEFGRSRHGRNRIVDCERALAGYAAAFETRANWQTIDRRTIHEWLAQHKHRRNTGHTVLEQSAFLESDCYAVEENTDAKSIACGLERQLPIDRNDSACGSSDNHSQVT